MASPYKDDADFRAKNGLSPRSSSTSSSSSSSSSSNSSSSSRSGSSSSGGSSSSSGGGYAYKDKYGFTHVVSDYNTAKQYSADGNVYSYSGSYSGGYARDENGNRLNLPIAGAVPFGNGRNDVYGGGNYLGGLASAPAAMSTNPTLANYGAYNTVSTAPKLTPEIPSLMPLRKTFEDKGFGVQYNPSGDIHIYDPISGNLLGTFKKGTYFMQNGSAYFNPADAQRLLSMGGPPSAMSPTSQTPLVPMTPDPVPTLDQLQPFKYEPFKMWNPTYSFSDSGNEVTVPTLAVRQDWYNRQDQLRNDYLTDWYRKQALAQQQAQLDWEKAKYNDPAEKAARDLQLQLIKSQIAENQAQAARSASGGSSSTKAKTPSTTAQADAIIQSRIGSFKRPIDFAAQIKREVESGKISASVGSAVLDRLQKMYPTEEALMQDLSTWNR